LHELTDDGLEAEVVLVVAKPDGIETEGTVTIKTQFLKPSVGGGQGVKSAVLSVKLMTVCGLDLTTQYPFKIKVTVLEKNHKGEDRAVAEETTRPSRTLSLRCLTEPLKRSCIQLSKLGHPAQVIADVLDVAVSQVEDCLNQNALNAFERDESTESLNKANIAAKEKQTKRLGVMYPLFEEILHLLVPICKRNQRVRMTLLDKNEARLGDATMGMDGLHDSTNLEIRGPFYLHANVEIVGSMRLMWLD